VIEQLRREIEVQGQRKVRTWFDYRKGAMMVHASSCSVMKNKIGLYLMIMVKEEMKKGRQKEEEDEEGGEQGGSLFRSSSLASSSWFAPIEDKLFDEFQAHWLLLDVL
jgi:hypothetical protein